MNPFRSYPTSLRCERGVARLIVPKSSSQLIFSCFRPRIQADLFSHYDVDINAVVKALGQKKPKGLLRAVWEQTALEAKGEFVKPFQTCAFDGRRNALTPYPFPIPEGELSPSEVADQADMNRRGASYHHCHYARRCRQATIDQYRFVRR